MTHGHDIDGMLAGPRYPTARELRLHLDNSHDERTSGWPWNRLHAFHKRLHDARLAEIEAAANLIAERLAAAEPAVVESVVGDDLTDEELVAIEVEVSVASLREHMTDAPMQDLIAGWARLARHVGPLVAAFRASRAEVERLRGSNDLLRSALSAARGAGTYDADAIARGAELARAFNAAGRPKMSEDPAPSDAAGEAEGLHGRAAASSVAPFEHVWTCRLQAGDETCECEAYSRS